MRHYLDLQSYLCPLPLLMTKKALSQLKAGEELIVLLNEQSSLRDFELLCYTMGITLERGEQANQLKMRR